MVNSPDPDPEALEVARKWCASKGDSWSASYQLGPGGTARVFEVASPDGLRALKIYDAEFSAGKKGEIERNRIDQQLALKGHNCPYLVQVYEGGYFQDRLYILMSRAPGTELEKRLGDVPRAKIRQIVDQIARAALFLKGRNLCHRDIKAANIFISDDFDQATLLDLSVVRNIYDPVGAGSDRDGQLPVLATARYSPPEYLFRLLDVGPELWHALTIYQLGALLHDLIMKEPLFEAEYRRSATNRYRFAWIVATMNPRIEAQDVDQDLIFIGRRSLDKDWERRSVLRLEDFLADANTRKAHAFQLLGFAGESATVRPTDDLARRLQRVRYISGSLEEAIRQYLGKNGITAKHEVKPGVTDTTRLLRFYWDAATENTEAGPSRVEFQLTLVLRAKLGGYHIGLSGKLSTSTNGAFRDAFIELPDIKDEPGAEVAVARATESALAQLAVDIMRPGPVTAEQ